MQERTQDIREQARSMLTKYLLTYAWLANEFEKRGVTLSTTTLNDYLSGRRKGNRSEEIVNMAYEILERYRVNYVECS